MTYVGPCINNIIMQNKIINVIVIDVNVDIFVDLYKHVTSLSMQVLYS